MTGALPRARAEPTLLLDARGLVRRYGGLTAIDGVDLGIAAGEVFGVIGPNGAGKTTLIGLLGGALKPTEGRIVLTGRDVTALPAPERARAGVGRTYQIPRPFLDMTVAENLEVAQFSRHLGRAGRDARAERHDILLRCGLLDCAGRPARALPLLRRKRLEVARALALRPRLLLLDEVGAGLVDAEVTELIGLIHALRAPDRAIVIIEHVIRVVRECCGRLAVLDFGRKIAEGPTADVLGRDDVAAVYLGTAHPGRKSGAPVAAAPSFAAPSFAAPSFAAPSFPGLRHLIAAPVARADAVPMLRLDGISAGYGQARVLQAVDFSVRQGEVVAILGTNGAGKTTLARTIAGVVHPTAGRLLLDGADITRCPPHERAARGIAHCLEGRRIFAPLSVEENLAIAARDLAARNRHERLDEVYTLFPDLRARSANPGTAMSGGQQQMLAIGRALMARPRLVIFDEISLGLAPVMMDRLYAALATLKAAGLTMLLVEQDVERALALADQVHVLERGRIALSGPAEAIRADPRLRKLYIGGAE